MNILKCLVCNHKKFFTYCDLGRQPLANNLSKQKLKKYKLAVNICLKCKHSQLTEEVNKKKLFSKYLYLSSQSKTLSDHFYDCADKYVKRFNLKKNSLIIDVGSNDGIGLKYFKEKKFTNFYGIEPAKNIALIANKNHIRTINSFLNSKIANKFSSKADLITASNVFAHNKDIYFLGKNLLKMLRQDGTLIIEVQYIITMLKDILYDNIYHEHIHYWSVNSLNNFFKRLNASIFDVELINTHGGSIRCYIKKNKTNINQPKIKNIISNEIKYGVRSIKTYHAFSKKIYTHKQKIIKFFFDNKNKKILGYGAAAKTSTLLNFLKLKNNFSIIDDNKLKQGFFIPGTKNKIISMNNLNNKVIDYLIVFAWNYFKEIKAKIRFAKKVISIRDLF